MALRMQEALRIVVVISDPTLVAEGDEQAKATEERSRLLRIGLLEAGYKMTLDADAPPPAQRHRPGAMPFRFPQAVCVTNGMNCCSNSNLPTSCLSPTRAPP